MMQALTGYQLRNCAARFGIALGIGVCPACSLVSLAGARSSKFKVVRAKIREWPSTLNFEFQAQSLIEF